MGVLKFVFVAIYSLAVSAHSNVGNANVGIAGGHKIPIQRAPYMVSLKENGIYHSCGGSIIHEQFILTAAHCFDEHREINVLVGSDHISGGRLYDIKKVYIHERYDIKTLDYDVALIKLNDTLSFNSEVNKVELPPQTMKLKRRTRLNVTGWGSTEVRTFSPDLLQAEIPLVWKQNCRKLYAKAQRNITSRMICAGEINHTSCLGDSGGPLTLGNIQVGVTSFGLEGCGVDPGVFTRVASMVSWINRKINRYY